MRHGRVRIAIIGGGIAGLTAAWVLQDQHEVTLFERAPRFGGHAHTVFVDSHGRSVPIEAGFEFFSRRGWPTFNKLLAQLLIETHDYQTRIAVYRSGVSSRGSQAVNGDAFVLQPMDMGGHVRPTMLTPQRIATLSQLGLVLASATPLMRARDTSLTVEQALARVPMGKRFREDFLMPFLLSGWCVDPEELLGFSAYNVLAYSYRAIEKGASVPMQEIRTGMGDYVDAMLKQMPRASLRASTDLAGIRRTDQGFELIERDGRTSPCDKLVIATNAQQACALLREVSGCEGMVRHLQDMTYFRTRIAIHGDARVMPQDKRDWSVVNIRHDGRHAHMTVWKPWRAEQVFRSWFSYDREPPAHVHHLIEYEHPKVTPRYYAAQRALNTLQGSADVWLAGMHMHDIDSHESALCSGVNAARGLAPDAPRLRHVT